jgi:hypothetical protein
MRDDRHIEDAPPTFGATTRISVNIEPEAMRMPEELRQRLYPTQRVGVGRALVVEMVVRALHHRVLRDAGDTSLSRHDETE